MNALETFLNNRALRRAQRRGATWLDAHAPGWWNGPAALKVAGTESRQLNHIELPLLDLGSGAVCVLGQLWGPGPGDDSAYSAARNHISRAEPFDPYELGFVTDDGYDALTRYWRNDITRRRAKAATNAG